MAKPATTDNPISTEQLVTIVQLACRAPSLHNSQPWRWAFANGSLHLFADHSRVGQHTDSTGREVILSCGAVCDHLQVAAAAAGWPVSVERYPNPRDHDHLVTAIFHRAESMGEHAHALAEAISSRRTDRLAFAAPEPWPEMELQLRTLLDGTGTYLDVINDSGRPALADASRRSEQRRLGDASYRYELLWWTGHSGGEGGVPTSALPSPVEASHVDVARDFPDAWTEFQSNGADGLVLPITPDLLPGMSGRQITGVYAKYKLADGGSARFLLGGDKRLALTDGKPLKTPGLSLGASGWTLQLEGDKTALDDVGLVLSYRAGG